MKAILKNYRFPIILLSSVIIGSILGINMGAQAEVIKPLGDIFLNLMFTLVVPLVFLQLHRLLLIWEVGKDSKRSCHLHLLFF